MKFLKLNFCVLIFCIGLNKSSEEEKSGGKAKQPCKRVEDEATVYDFSETELLSKKRIHFSQFRGKALLIVNVASFSHNAFQFYELNALHSNYEELEVLAFPCNQFGKNEPGANGTEIYHTMKHVRPGHSFEPRMHLFRKTEVNGEHENVLFTFLKDRCPPTRDDFEDPRDLFYRPLRSSDVRWDFEKFLVGFDGRPVLRYDSETRAKEIMDDIERLKPPLNVKQPSRRK